MRLSLWRVIGERSLSIVSDLVARQTREVLTRIDELQQASVKFSLPCDECEDEEKERFEEQVCDRVSLVNDKLTSR